MDSTQLTSFYDRLKSEFNKDDTPSPAPMMRVGKSAIGSTLDHPVIATFNRKASIEADKLRENCRKHILLDIYVNILPLDDDFKCNNMGQMKKDVDCMLQGKNMSATQYLTSCYEATKAPLLEYILRATGMIGDQYMEDAKEELKDAVDHDIDIAEPKAPDVEELEVQDQLNDVKKDTEYEDFMDKLKKKTTDKIVKDVTEMINGEKEKKEMTFDPTPEAPVEESVVAASLDYINNKLIKENVELADDAQDIMIAMAIREAALNEIDNVFNVGFKRNSSMVTNMRLGRGTICNESSVNMLTESYSIH